MSNQWDDGQVTYSQQNQQMTDDPLVESVTEQKHLQSHFRQFLREFRLNNSSENFYYSERLKANYSQQNYSIEIDFAHLNEFSQKLGEVIRESPVTALPLFEKAAQEVVAENKYPKPNRDEIHKIQVQLINLQRNITPIRDLDSQYISKLVKVPGIIISATKPSSKATKITLMCTNCRTVRHASSSRGFGTILLPRKCENANNENNDRACPLDPFTVLSDKSEFIDIQRLKLQESPEDIPTGEMPKQIWLFCERKLVNKVTPGARVNISGIFKLFDGPISGRRNDKHDISVRKPYIEVIGIEQMNISEKTGHFAPEDEEELNNLSKMSDIKDKIAESIAPAIWGSDDIKKAIACLLFGGSRKFLKDGMRLRGDINVLLLGDPSVAKSQFLKFVHEVAPIGVYTSGKGSSASGLTASVLREPGSGEFHLEGGAMVLADGGVVCIDEFDKMRESDRVAIHEAMEQQTISIAKAGITTILNSRTSVLAAANPIFGRYDELRSTNENIDFETTILSRFDLIFIIRDIKDRNKDSKLANHIMDLHINVNQLQTEKVGPISPQLLSKYIRYAKTKCHPRLSKQAAEMLKNHYVTFRQQAKQRENDTGEQSAIPLTVRQLESLIRISESLAKMELREEANVDDVKEAVRLFKVATLRAANQGSYGGGGEGSFASSDFRDSVQKVERNLRRTLPVGSATSVKKLMDAMMRRNVTQSAVMKCLDIMHQRGEIEYRARRRQVYRKK